jgi:hypothetical protein
MIRTSQELLNIIAITQCCAADMAYKALNEDMFLKPNRYNTLNNVRYIQAIISILYKYNDVLYTLSDTETCLDEDEIDTMIQELSNLCDNCGCCTDADSIKQDI